MLLSCVYFNDLSGNIGVCVVLISDFHTALVNFTLTATDIHSVILRINTLI